MKWSDNVFFNTFWPSPPIHFILLHQSWHQFLIKHLPSLDRQQSLVTSSSAAIPVLSYACVNSSLDQQQQKKLKWGDRNDAYLAQATESLSGLSMCWGNLQTWVWYVSLFSPVFNLFYCCLTFPGFPFTLILDLVSMRPENSFFIIVCHNFKMCLLLQKPFHSR